MLGRRCEAERVDWLFALDCRVEADAVVGITAATAPSYIAFVELGIWDSEFDCASRPPG